MRIIKVWGTYDLLVDDEDYEFCSSLSLGIKGVYDKGNTVYARINSGEYESKLLHRILLGVTDPLKLVDHKDRNGLNCQRYNLRITNKVGNALNSTVQRTKKSGLPKGIINERGRFAARITINCLTKYLGSFKTVEEAEVAYKKELNNYWNKNA